MSQTSRMAPGDRQGRNNGKTTGRFKSAIQTKRIREEGRAAIHELGDARRGSVYRTDVEFAPDDAPVPLPARGSAKRAKLIEEVVRLRQTGMSHMKIANALYPRWPHWSAATIANLLREASEK